MKWIKSVSLGGAHVPGKRKKGDQTHEEREMNEHVCARGTHEFSTFFPFLRIDHLKPSHSLVCVFIFLVKNDLISTQDFPAIIGPLLLLLLLHERAQHNPSSCRHRRRKIDAKIASIRGVSVVLDVCSDVRSRPRRYGGLEF